MGLLKHGVIPMTTENLLVLSERCRDPALSVKKKALQCLGELLTVSVSDWFPGAAGAGTLLRGAF